jgi:hypothetical protein
VLYHASFPVDVRHNAKIFREKLGVWAGKEIASRMGGDLKDDLPDDHS